MDCSKIEILTKAMAEYKYGSTSMTDKDYDQLKCSLPNYSFLNFINWDDVEILPTFKYIIDKYNISKPKVYNEDTDISEYEEIVKGKYSASKSMVMTTNIQDLSTFLRDIFIAYYSNKKPIEVNLSLKMDGWHTRNFFNKGKLKLSHSKAKATTNIIEFTDTMTEVFNKTSCVNISNNMPLCIQGELCLHENLLPYLRKKYNKPFKNVRNSISSFIYKKLEISDLCLPTFFGFNIIKEDSEPLFDKISDTYDFIYKLGFNIPPNITVVQDHLEDVELCYSEFIQKCDAAYRKLSEFYDKEFNTEFKSDGIVVQANHYNLAQDMNMTNQNGNYSNGMLAFKGGVWGKEYFEAVVKDIEIARSKQNRQPTIILEPCDTGYNVVTRCEMDNLNNLLRNKIEIGDRILLSIHSKQIIQFERNLDK